MPNKNYVAGRAFEYATMRELEKRGYTCIRASGSHGEYDVVGYRNAVKPIFVQCKKTDKIATSRALLDAFVEKTKPAVHYHQAMFVKIKGLKEPMEVIV